jgi:hypothetical protein
MLTFSTPSNISEVTSSPTLNFSESPLFKGNSLIVVNSDTLRVVLPSPNLPSFLSARIQIIRAS